MRMLSGIYNMEEIRQDTPAPRDDPRESFLPVSQRASSMNYHNFGGFGGVRQGVNNPYRLHCLNRNHYPYPPPQPAPPFARSPVSTRRFQASNALSLMDDYSARESVALHGGGDMVAENSAQESINDCPMTTPDQSENRSVAGQEAVHGLCSGIFGAPSNLRPRPSFHPPTAFYDQSNPFRSCVRPASVADLLNPAFPAQTSRSCFSSIWTQNPATQHHPNPNINQQIPNFPTPSSPAVTLYSAISTDTIRSSLSIQEQRSFHFITLYNACLDASNTYISSLRRHQRISTRRYHPYSPPPRYHSHPHSNNSAKLMDNISVICTHMWRKARNDGMAPHRAEAEAVGVMRDLYAWGKVVARGLGEGGGLGDDVEMESLDGWSDLEEESRAVRVGEAAKSLCRWFRDRRARGICEEVLGELRGLEEMEVRRQGERESEDGVGIL